MHLLRRTLTVHISGAMIDLNKLSEIWPYCVWQALREVVVAFSGGQHLMWDMRGVHLHVLVDSPGVRFPLREINWCRYGKKRTLQTLLSLRSRMVQYISPSSKIIIIFTMG